ncbi:MAG: MFS transporter [Acidobacteriota bacterium]|jgi:FSR family fosmidomycin resistance protein-like MFS transporter
MSQPDSPARPRGFPLRVAASGLGALAVLSLGHLVIDAYSSAYAPVLAILRERFALSFAQVGWGAAVFAFSASIMQPAYGILSDRIKSGVIIALAPGIAAVGFGAVPLVDAYPAMLGFLFLAGVGVAAFHPQGATQAADTMPHRPSLAMALFIGAGNVGFALGPALVAWTYALWGWEGLWHVGVPGLVTTLLLIPMAPARLHAAHHERGRARDALRARWRPLLNMYLFVVVRGTVQLIFVGFLPLYLIDSGMSVRTAGTALSLFLAAGSLGSIVGGLLGDRFGERAIIRLSMAASLPLFVVAFLLPTIAARVALLSAAFFVLLFSNPLTVVLAQSWVPHHRSTVSSLLMGFAWGIGGLVAPVFGRVADLHGLGPSLLVIGLLPLLGTILAWTLPARDV